ncbi:MAG: CDP-alcohol phosphatidyltransferase family protein [Promethearchaeota archaeon]
MNDSNSLKDKNDDDWEFANILRELKLKDFATLMGTFCGVSSIALSIGGHAYRAASFFIFLSILMDFLDGFIARKMHQVNELGKELDSLSDAICFGVAPAILLFRAYAVEPTSSGLPPIPQYIMVFPTAFFIFGAVIRLAWFNIDKNEGYTGLVTPISAATAIFIHLIDYYGAQLPALGQNYANAFRYIVPIIMGLLPYLNVSPFLIYGKNIRKKSGRLKYVFMAVAILGSVIFLMTMFFFDALGPIIVGLMYFILGLIAYLIIYGFRNYLHLKRDHAEH